MMFMMMAMRLWVVLESSKHANERFIENKGVRGVRSLREASSSFVRLGVIPELATLRQKDSERVERFDDSFLRASAIFSFNFYSSRDLRYSFSLSPFLSLSLFHPEQSRAE